MKVIGDANEFWRVRLTRIDTTSDLSFEWHDDILYRTPDVEVAAEVERWSVQAIRTDDVDTIIEIGSFEHRDDADRFMKRVLEDLADMTKSLFEETYLVSSEPADDEADTV